MTEAYNELKIQFFFWAMTGIEDGSEGNTNGAWHFQEMLA